MSRISYAWYFVVDVNNAGSLYVYYKLEDGMVCIATRLQMNEGYIVKTIVCCELEKAQPYWHLLNPTFHATMRNHIFTFFSFTFGVLYALSHFLSLGKLSFSK